MKQTEVLILADLLMERKDLYLRWIINLEGSGMEQYMNTDNYRYLCDRDTVKFVVSNEKDLYKMYDICKKYSLGENAIS